MFNFSENDLKYYPDNILPNINPNTGYKLHMNLFTVEKVSEYHNHGYYEVFLLTKGSAFHYVNNIKQTLRTGSLVFIRPDDKHCFQMLGKNEPLEFVNFAFSPNHATSVISFFEGIYDFSKLLQDDFPVHIQLSSHTAMNLIKSFDNINTIPYNNFVEQKLAVRQILTDVIPMFLDDENTESDEIPNWLVRTYNKMNKPENFIAGIDRMTELSGKTPEHLSRTLKKYYNITPSELVNNLRLNYAVNLLTNTNMKVIDICFESGFVNLSTFYNIFKNEYGVTPSKFRKNFIPPSNHI